MIKPKYVATLTLITILYIPCQFLKTFCEYETKLLKTLQFKLSVTFKLFTMKENNPLQLTYENFVEIYGKLLESNGVPGNMWPTLFQKLSDEVIFSCKIILQLVCSLT